ncbi:MAG: hypothetical protein JWQ11_939, partial [Rhizobacter sp.]|nr:hypothetical protein [Rhizobacter sp.]
MQAQGAHRKKAKHEGQARRPSAQTLREVARSHDRSNAAAYTDGDVNQFGKETNS